MWFNFFACTIICVGALYGPGYMLIRGLRIDSAYSLALAPLGSLIGYAALGTTYTQFGITCNLANVLCVWAAACASFLLTSWFLGNQRRFPKTSRREWLLLCANVLTGLAVCLYVFALAIDSPLSYYCRFDNQVHYALARHFVDSGAWSALRDWSGALADTSRSGYYPAGWHTMAASLSSLTGWEMPLIFNALNATLAGITFPASCYAMIRALFPEKTTVRTAGAIASMAFGCLPWVLLLKGQLLANLISFAITPAAIAAVVHYVNTGALKHWRALMTVSVVSVLDFAFAHPNGLFTALVFLAPFIIHRSAVSLRDQSKLSGKNPLRKPWFVWLLGLSIAFAIWQLMLFAPPLQNVVTYNNTGNLNLNWAEAVFAALGLTLYPAQPLQWLVMVVCLVGFVALARRRSFWLALPALWMLFVYAACRCTEASYTLRTFLAGFWYSDPYRTLCCAELFLIPVLAVGLVWTAKGLQRAAKKLSEKSALAVVLVAFSVLNYFPYCGERPMNTTDNPDPHFEPLPGTAFGYFHRLIAEGYSMSSEQIYSAREQAFVQKVRELIPDDAVVVNQPHDGSVFAYGLDGLNTYYRHIDLNTETEESAVIRQGLDAVASDAEVQAALAAVGAQYVLQLDAGEHPADEADGTAASDKPIWLLQTNEDNWKNFDGVNRITDSTPGFEVVLAEGDMRLYKIVP